MLRELGFDALDNASFALLFRHIDGLESEDGVLRISELEEFFRGVKRGRPLPPALTETDDERRQRLGLMSPEEEAAAKAAAAEAEEAAETLDMPEVGSIVRALDQFRNWYDAKVIDTRPGEVKIHFIGYKKTPTHVKWLPLTSADLQLSKRSDKGPGASSRPTMQRLDAAGTTDGEDETSEQDGEEDEAVSVGKELDTPYGKAKVNACRDDGVVVASLAWGELYIQA